MNQANATHSCHCNCHRQCQCNCRPSPRPTASLTLTCRACTEETCDNLPGPGRALDNLYQFLGHKLERWLGVVADKAGLGPAAAGRRVEKAMKVIYDWDRAQFWRKSGWNVPVHLAKLRLEHVEVAKREVKQGCKALTKYSQWVPDVVNALFFFDVSPPNVLSILKVKTKHYSHIHTHFTEAESTKKIFSTTYHRLHEIETSSDGFDLWNSLYESDFDEDALSRLLRTSRTVLLSVEHNGFNSLLQRMIEPAPSDMYALQEYEPLKTKTEIKSCWTEFCNYMLHPELSSLTFYYLNQSHHLRVEVYGYFHLDVDAYIEVCLKLFLLLPKNFSDWGRYKLPLFFRFIHRDKRWIDKQLRLLDDPKKTANFVSIDPAVLGKAVHRAGFFVEYGLVLIYRETSRPSSLFLERYEQVHREIAPLSEEDERQLRYMGGMTAYEFRGEDKTF